jgi:hypothetical protein
LTAFGANAADGSVELVWDAAKNDPSTFAQFMGAVIPSAVLANYTVNWIRINVSHPPRDQGELHEQVAWPSSELPPPSPLSRVD